MNIHELQIALVEWLSQPSAVKDFMHTTWAWPVIESLHFLGLCLLIGGVGTFDLRLLGVAKRVPIAQVHRLIPWGIAGFVLNIATGTLFVMTEPDQYIYNSSFHTKLLFMTIAGVNASLFYVTSWRRVFRSDASLTAPAAARVIAAVSLCAWLVVISAGRLITFFRPGPCSLTEVGLLLTCQPGK